MTTEQNMAARLARIMGDVGRVEKKGQIRSQGSGPSYNFARDSDVLEAVNPKLAEAGCVLVPEHTELLSMEPTMSGRQMIANIKTAWHVTDGKESLRFETFGQGADSGDKALPKAQSNARKYAYFMLFHIVTGDDPDQHASDQSESNGRESRQGGATPNRARSTPTPRNKGEALGFLAEVMRDHNLNFAAVDAIAKRQGIERGSASVQEIVDLIAAIESPDGVPTDPAGEAEARAASPSPSELLEQVVAITGGELVDAEPPRPGTPEYRALPSGAERAKARAYWDARPEPEEPSLAEQLGAPLA